MVATSVVVFISSIARSRNAGSMRFTACGRMMRRIVCRGFMPSARAASHWPRSIDTMPPRKTSAKKAADWIENVTTAATNGVISTRIRIGSAKKNQNSWTSGGVVRNTSMTRPAGHRSARYGDNRNRARTSPSGIPNASAQPVTFSVFRSPSAKRSAFAQTGAKSQRCTRRLLQQFLRDRWRALRIETESGEELVVPTLRLSGLVVVRDFLVDPRDERLVVFLSRRHTRRLPLHRRGNGDLSASESLARREERGMEQAHRVDASGLERSDRLGIAWEALDRSLADVFGEELVHAAGLRNGDANRRLIEVGPGRRGQIVARQHGERVVEKRVAGEIDRLRTLGRGVQHVHEVDAITLKRGDRRSPCHLDRLELDAERRGHRLAHRDADAGAPLAAFRILRVPGWRLGHAHAEHAALLDLGERAAALAARRECHAENRRCCSRSNQERAALDRHDGSPCPRSCALETTKASVLRPKILRLSAALNRSAHVTATGAGWSMSRMHGAEARRR